jgi:hypothetical protein
MNRLRFLMFGVALSLGWLVPVHSIGQNVANSGIPDVSALPPTDARGAAGTTGGVVATFSDQKVRPLTEGPLHEAFLSPRKDRNPDRADKTPPPPVTERPGVDPPSTSAACIGMQVGTTSSG